MKLHIFSIMLDAMPFCTWHLPIFNRLWCDWNWRIAHGAAMNVRDTSWCKPQEPRLSRDGTTEYLSGLRHPQVTVMHRQSWAGKVLMCNACLPVHTEDCVLLEVDCDEFWTPDQLERMVSVFENDPTVGAMQFYCRYFVGQNIVITSDNNYGNRHGEWMRAWRYTGGSFLTHEPPLLSKIAGRVVSRRETREMGLVFDHYAYALPSQVAFKEKYYGYDHAGEHWQRLQQNRTWPVKLSKFLPWVTDDAVADLLHK